MRVDDQRLAEAISDGESCARIGEGWHLDPAFAMDLLLDLRDERERADGLIRSWREHDAALRGREKELLKSVVQETAARTASEFGGSFVDLGDGDMAAAEEWCNDVVRTLAELAPYPGARAIEVTTTIATGSGSGPDPAPMEPDEIQ